MSLFGLFESDEEVKAREAAEALRLRLACRKGSPKDDLLQIALSREKLKEACDLVRAGWNLGDFESEYTTSYEKPEGGFVSPIPWAGHPSLYFAGAWSSIYYTEPEMADIFAGRMQGEGLAPPPFPCLAVEYDQNSSTAPRECVVVKILSEDMTRLLAGSAVFAGAFGKPGLALADLVSGIKPEDFKAAMFGKAPVREAIENWVCEPGDPLAGLAKRQRLEEVGEAMSKAGKAECWELVVGERLAKELASSRISRLGEGSAKPPEEPKRLGVVLSIRRARERAVLAREQFVLIDATEGRRRAKRGHG
jgi:hypothetical protein